MRKTSILKVLGVLLLGASSVAQTDTPSSLTDAQVDAAINHALRGKRHAIGLTLNDVQTAIFSGMACDTCGTSGYTIRVYTAESWIEEEAVRARDEMTPFNRDNVTTEMRLPYLRVVALPSTPEYVTGAGMSAASSVHRVVLSSTDKNQIIQPLNNSNGVIETNSAFRSVDYASATSVFSLRDVEALRRKDKNGEFFIVVVGDNQNKFFKVKARFFKQLFGN